MELILFDFLLKLGKKVLLHYPVQPKMIFAKENELKFALKRDFKYTK